MCNRQFVSFLAQLHFFLHIFLSFYGKCNLTFPPLKEHRRAVERRSERAKENENNGAEDKTDKIQ